MELAIPPYPKPGPPPEKKFWLVTMIMMSGYLSGLLRIVRKREQAPKRARKPTPRPEHKRDEQILLVPEVVLQEEAHAVPDRLRRLRRVAVLP